MIEKAEDREDVRSCQLPRKNRVKTMRNRLEFWVLRLHLVIRESFRVRLRCQIEYASLSNEADAETSSQA